MHSEYRKSYEAQMVVVQMMIHMLRKAWLRARWSWNDDVDDEAPVDATRCSSLIAAVIVFPAQQNAMHTASMKMSSMMNIGNLHAPLSKFFRLIIARYA